LRVKIFVKKLRVKFEDKNFDEKVEDKI